jgi:hypothetical protein
MPPIVIITCAVACVGLLAALRGRNKAIVVVGAALVCLAIAALIWTRPSTERAEQQDAAITNVCREVRSHLRSFRSTQERAGAPPWSEQARVWNGLVQMVSSVEPVCFADSGWPCIPSYQQDMPAKSYAEVKPHLDRVIHALEAHTRCRAPVPGGGKYYDDNTSGFDATK